MKYLKCTYYTAFQLYCNTFLSLIAQYNPFFMWYWALVEPFRSLWNELFLAPPHLRQISSDWLPLTSRMFEHQEGSGSVGTARAACLRWPYKLSPLYDIINSQASKISLWIWKFLVQLQGKMFDGWIVLVHRHKLSHQRFGSPPSLQIWDWRIFRNALNSYIINPSAVK